MNGTLSYAERPSKPAPFGERLRNLPKERDPNLEAGLDLLLFIIEVILEFL
jgi:hypothetical protein